MDELEYNSQIEKLASLMVDDKLSPDEQDPNKLKKYHDYAKIHYLVRKEEGTHQIFSSETYDEEALNYADEERALLKEVKGKSEREKIKKIFKSVFREELIEV